MISEFFPRGKDLKFSGGVEARNYFIAKNLSKKHRVTVICAREPHTKRSETINGIAILRVGPVIKYNAGSGKDVNPIKLLLFIKDAVNIGKSVDADLVEGTNFIAHFVAKQISISKKIPVIFWYPDVFIGQWIKTSGPVSGTTGFFLEKLNLTRGANCYIAISQITKQKLVNSGINTKKIAVLPCGIDETEFRTVLKKTAIPVIITISRLVSYKRLEDLIFAFALLRQRVKANLVIIGRGPERDRLIDLAKNLKVENNLSIKADLKRAELLKYLKTSTLFCLPSEVEGFGISTIEAAAAGTPFVVSDIGVFKEVTKNGQGGYLFKTGSITDLNKKLTKLLTDKSLYARKKRELKNLVKYYNWSDIASETERIYKKLI